MLRLRHKRCLRIRLSFNCLIMNVVDLLSHYGEYMSQKNEIAELVKAAAAAAPPAAAAAEEESPNEDDQASDASAREAREDDEQATPTVAGQRR